MVPGPAGGTRSGACWRRWFRNQLVRWFRNQLEEVVPEPVGAGGALEWAVGTRWSLCGSPPGGPAAREGGSAFFHVRQAKPGEGGCESNVETFYGTQQEQRLPGKAGHRRNRVLRGSRATSAAKRTQGGRGPRN